MRNDPEREALLVVKGGFMSQRRVRDFKLSGRTVLSAEIVVANCPNCRDCLRSPGVLVASRGDRIIGGWFSLHRFHKPLARPGEEVPALRAETFVLVEIHIVRDL